MKNVFSRPPPRKMLFVSKYLSELNICWIAMNEPRQCVGVGAPQLRRCCHS